MRTSCLLSLVAALVLLAATCAIAQSTGEVRFDNYGLSVSLPVPYERMPMQLPAINGMVEAYKSNGLVYLVIATDEIQPKNATARQALNALTTMMSQVADKVPAMGLHTIAATSAQGKSAVGFGGKVIENQNKTAKTAMDYATQIPPELKQMYGNDIYQAALMVPFTETGRMVAAVAVVGPTSQQMSIDAIAMRMMSSLTIGKPAAPKPKDAADGGVAPAPVAAKVMNELKKGQIELIGTVSAIDKASKSLSMMVSHVTSYGQPSVVLNPARQKKVFVKSIPAGVKEGSSVVVLAADSGVGKPVKAESVKTMEPSK